MQKEQLELHFTCFEPPAGDFTVKKVKGNWMNNLLGKLAQPLQGYVQIRYALSARKNDGD